MERSILLVPLSLLRFGTSPKDIHKVDENSLFSIEKTLCTTDYFSRWYSANSFLKWGTDTCKKHSDISSLESRFSDKTQKISTRTMSEYIIFGYENQLNRNDTDPSTREKREDCTTVPGSAGEVISLHKGTMPINWLPCIKSNCSSASTSAVLSQVATADFRIARNRGLQLKNNFVCGSEGRTGLVGAKCSFNQGKINNFCISSVNNSFWCFFKRMESFLQRT